MREGTRGNLWRETADLLYLLRNAGVREGFFPTGTNTVPIEPADPADHSAIRSIVELHEGPEATVALLTWLEDKPEYFSVARDREGGVAGFSIFMPATELSERIISRDPVAAAMHRDLGDLESPDLAYIYRRILDAEEGEAPGETSAAASLDGKRTYMEVRPAIRYVYFAVRDYDAYEPIMEPLGFEPVLAPPIVDGTQYQLVMLDMGPESVDGWLGRVVAAELGIDDGASGMLDRQARTLRSPTGPVHLTPLEFGVMTELSDRAGEAVTRVELTEAVWGYSADSSSNVVEVVVGSLRKKLGEQADLVETVRGVGYRLRER
jgi:hypothetical protein